MPVCSRRSVTSSHDARRYARLLARATTLATLVGLTYAIVPGPPSVATTMDSAASNPDEPRATVHPPRRSERVLDRFERTLGRILGRSNRGVPERVEVTRVRSGEALEITWAIDRTQEASLSLRAATSEGQKILQSVKEHPLTYRRVILKGTSAVPSPAGSAETAVVRAVYMRSTVRAIDFDAFDPAAGQTILELADELRLAAVLGGYGIPSEPETEP